MPSLPVGTVTFLFTDIEGSTRLVQELGSRFREVLEAHHVILRRAISAHRGVEVSTEGDAFFAVFPSASDAVSAAVAAQSELAATSLPNDVEIRVRMGLHTGNGELGGDNYVGVDVHRGARIAAAGHGGQVLLSESTRALVEPALPEAVDLRDLGQHRLKDIRAAEHLYQLVIAGLPSDFPALRTLDASPTNLVAPASPLVGRDRELLELSDLLASNRLLTLTGPGGTGKTRLATELGARALPNFKDGAFFVPLETLTERSLVSTAIAQAVGARGSGQREPDEILAEHLAERQLLLILDNFEQVVVAAPLVARMRTDAKDLTIVVTSRIPLHLSGEQEYPVSPLTLPGAGATIDVEALSKIEAVALFVECARRVQPSFQLTNDNAAAVVAICQRLDGLPLAIELACARVKVLSPDNILARLGQALPFLAGGRVDQPDRQRALRAAIEWSYQLLSSAEQQLFRRLTVFTGGWSVDAAEEVAAPTGELPFDVLDGLTALVDQSLVRPAMQASPHEPRFEMLQLIREYGAERLAESEEAATIGRRHAEWVLALTEAAAPSLEGATDFAWFDRLAREHDNVRAALRWLIDHGERELGLRLASATWRFWQQRGYIAEGRRWFDGLLPGEPEEGALDPGVLAAALTAAGGLAYWQNALDDAEAHYQSALELDRRHDRKDRLGDDVYNLAFVAMARLDVQNARRLFLESAELFTAAGQSTRLADTTGARGALEMRAGNLEAARDLLEEARRLNLEEGNRRRATDNAMVLGNVYLLLNDMKSARDRLLTILEEATEMGDVTRWPFMLDIGAVMALKEHRQRDVLRLAGASARRRANLGGGAPSFVISDFSAVVAEARALLEEQHGPGAADEAFAEGELLDDATLAALLGGPMSPELVTNS
jgi:predicted ATPase/class 3 adenylate cyclase